MVFCCVRIKEKSYHVLLWNHYIIYTLTPGNIIPSVLLRVAREAESHAGACKDVAHHWRLPQTSTFRNSPNGWISFFSNETLPIVHSIFQTFFCFGYQHIPTYLIHNKKYSGELSFRPRNSSRSARRPSSLKLFVMEIFCSFQSKLKALEVTAVSCLVITKIKPCCEVFVCFLEEPKEIILHVITKLSWG